MVADKIISFTGLNNTFKILLPNGQNNQWIAISAHP